MCKLCETHPVYEFTNQRKVCKTCFIHWFEKKVLYTIRKFEMIKPGDAIGYENQSDFRSVVLEEILKSFSKKANIKLVKLPSKKKINKIAIPSTIDSESDKIVKELINGKAKNLDKAKPVYKNFIKPLYLFLDKEVLLYAELKQLKFSKQKKDKDKISEFINDLEKKHPEIKWAIINGFEEVL